jgi:hypothetical protein
VAIDAPIHVQRLGSPDQCHLIYLAMASRATDTLCDVNAVIKVDEIRQLMDTNPAQRLVLLKTDEHWAKNFLILKNLRMTRHTRRCRRNASEGREFNRRMAKATIQSNITYMVLVTKGWQLLNGCVQRWNLSNAAAPNHDKSERQNQDQTRDEFDQKYESRPKDLSHARDSASVRVARTNVRKRTVH